MKNILLLFVLLYLTDSVEPQNSNLEETILVEGQPIIVLKDRGKNLRLGGRLTTFVNLGDTKNPPGTYPWEVSIGLVNPKALGSWEHYCGGVIVSHTHIVTSANCMDFMTRYSYINSPVTDIHVRAGDNNLKIENEIITSIQEIRISKYTVHPEFNRTDFDAQHYKNIAVIELEKALNFTDFRKSPYTCLPSRKQMPLPNIQIQIYP